MDEYGSMSNEEFATKWSIDGRPISPTKIINTLRAQNIAQDKKYAQLAKEEYRGDIFIKIFCYQSHGKVCVMKDVHAIAKRYLELKQSDNNM